MCIGVRHKLYGGVMRHEPRSATRYVLVVLAAVIAGGLVGLMLSGLPVEDLLGLLTDDGERVSTVASPTPPGTTVVPSRPPKSRPPTPTQTPARPPATATGAALAGARTPTASPAPSPVSEAQARQVVEDLFGALDREDFASAVSTGHGKAREQIRRMVLAVEEQARERGVQPDLDVTRLELDASGRRGAERLVRSDFTVVAHVKLGGLRVPVQTADGSAVFLVESIGGQPRITEIADVQGLPGT